MTVPGAWAGVFDLGFVQVCVAQTENKARKHEGGAGCSWGAISIL